MKYTPKKDAKDAAKTGLDEASEAKPAKPVVYEMVGANGFAMPFIKVEN